MTHAYANFASPFFPTITMFSFSFIFILVGLWRQNAQLHRQICNCKRRHTPLSFELALHQCHHTVFELGIMAASNRSACWTAVALAFLPIVHLATHCQTLGLGFGSLSPSFVHTRLRMSINCCQRRKSVWSTNQSIKWPISPEQSPIFCLPIQLNVCRKQYQGYLRRHWDHRIKQYSFCDSSGKLRPQNNYQSNTAFTVRSELGCEVKTWGYAELYTHWYNGTCAGLCSSNLD